MQRLHEDDLVGHVLGQEPSEVLSFPAIAEADEEHWIETILNLKCFRRRHKMKFRFWRTAVSASPDRGIKPWLSEESLGDVAGGLRTKSARRLNPASPRQKRIDKMSSGLCSGRALDYLWSIAV